MPRLGLGMGATESTAIEVPFAQAYSLAVDGTGDQADIAFNSVLKPANYISISAWVKPTDTVNYSKILCFAFNAANWNSPHTAWNLAANAAADPGTPMFEMATPDAEGFSGNNLGRGSTAWCRIESSASIADGAWSHLVATYDGSNMRIYINSTLTGTRARTGIIYYNNNVPVIIGAGRDSTVQAGKDAFNGLIDEVGLWDVALSAADITAIYNSGTPTDLTRGSSYDSDKSGDLVGYWRFEENTGTTIADSSTNSNTAALINDATFSSTIPS